MLKKLLILVMAATLIVNGSLVSALGDEIYDTGAEADNESAISTDSSVDSSVDSSSDSGNDAGGSQLIEVQETRSEGLIEDGTYIIRSAKDTNYVMDIYGGSKASGGNVNLYRYNGSQAQIFRLKHNKDNAYTITNLGSGLVLDAAGGKANNGTNVQQYSSIKGTLAQQWSIEADGDGYKIVSMIDFKHVVDLAGGVTENGRNIQLYEANGSLAQRWYFTKYESERDKLDKLAADNRDTIDDGDYRIYTSLDDDYNVDIAGASKSRGANVQLDKAGDSDSQRFRVSHDAAGYVTFTNINSGKVLDVRGGTAANGTNVWQYDSNGTYAQKWIAIKEENGIKIVSALNENYVLDLSGALVSPGSNIQLYKSNDSGAQRWNLESYVSKRSEIDAFAMENADVIPDGIYEISSAANITTDSATDINTDTDADNAMDTAIDTEADVATDTTIDTDADTATENKYVLHVEGGSEKNGANIEIYQEGLLKSQGFTVTHDKKGYVTFTNVSSGKVLDVYAGTAANWQNVWQYNSNNSYAQKWIVTKDEKGYKIVSAIDTDYVLDLRGGSCTNQANVQIYEDNGTPAQRWNFNAPEYYAEAADILFIGDSRTQGMEENVLAGADCYYKGAKGYSYMTGYALPYAETSGCKYLVVQFGVNDRRYEGLSAVDLAAKYAECLNTFAAEHPDIKVFMVSVAPCFGNYSELGEYMDEFNGAIPALLDGVEFIDITNIVHFNSPDGLHYTADTYVEWYKYVVERVLSWKTEGQ